MIKYYIEYCNGNKLININKENLLISAFAIMMISVAITTVEAQVSNQEKLSIYKQTELAAMKAANSMNQVTGIVELCSFMAEDIDYTKKCLTFTNEYNKAIENIIKLYNPSN